VTLAAIIAATFAGGVVSVLLAATVSLPWLPRIADQALAFAAGALLAVAFTGAVPRALELGLDPDALGLTLLLGLFGFFLLEQLFLRLHGAGSAGRGPARIALVAAGDGLHNFVDGVLIAAAFLTDPVLGWTAAVGVLAHELPQELADFIVLLDAGLSRGHALLVNAASGAATVVGGVAGYFLLAPLEAAVPYVIAVAAASFIYLALAGLVPALQAAGERAGLRAVLVAGGGLVVWAIRHAGY
jgi:zinc and cadmium transporter